VLHAWLGQKPDLSDAHLGATSLPLEAANGFAGVAPVTGLQPERRYHYALTLNPTPPDPAGGEYPSFTTAPAPGERTSFSFAFGSCFRPKNELGGGIFRSIEERRKSENLRFILLLGDQIYADAYHHNSIDKIACSLQEYRDVYAYTWSRPPFRGLLACLPAYMTLDDHEVDDDWRWKDSSRLQAVIPWWDRAVRWLKGRSPQERQLPLLRVRNALQAYWEHQGMHAPRFELPPRLDPVGQYELAPQDPGSLAYTFYFGAAAFFVLDTRTMRVAGLAERSMLGEGQWEALKSWLRAVKNEYPVKFLVTSCSMLHPMWHDIPRDRWSGYPDERDRLLHYLAANGIEGVYLLAGDLHASHAVSAELYGPEGRSLPLWEFCSTPFEQDPNRLARYTYLPLRSGPVRNSRREFSVSQNNFGLVRVDYSGGTRPKVTFQIIGEDGTVLGAVES
jgi:phosphodiesterase/alkaline phosphatase D-like protein